MAMIVNLPKKYKDEFGSLFRVDARKYAGIYFLVDKNEIVYIGQSKNFFRRLGDHISSKKVFEFAYFIPVRESDLDIAEHLLIKEINPKYNCGYNLQLIVQLRKIGIKQLNSLMECNSGLSLDEMY